jgi:hypothetical protein
MTEEKFQNEVLILEKFFTKFCEEKHRERFKKEYQLKYKQTDITFCVHLCNECHKLISYSFERLLECPHEIKPRCRKCPTPCYEKPQWKEVAKIMRYSGFQLGVLKVKKFLRIKK